MNVSFKKCLSFMKIFLSLIIVLLNVFAEACLSYLNSYSVSYSTHAFQIVS